jgi:6-phosphogluconolactonase
MKFTEDSLFVSPTPVKLAEELSGWFFAQFQELAENKKSFYVAISGGNTPILFFNHLASRYSQSLNWKNIHFFWADERCVPPAHNDSNYKTANINLLSKIPIPLGNIHRIKGEGNIPNEVENYRNEILSLVPCVNNLPEFDLIMLGMGDDGHTASLFPKQEDLLHSKNICEESVNPATGLKRITLTPACINNAGKVVFQITGLAKSNIVNDILLKRASYKDYPAAHIKPVSNNLYWFLDAGAAKGLFN